MRKSHIVRTMLLTGGNRGGDPRMDRGYDAPESRSRDRTGREHYDNGRYAPTRGYEDTEIYAGRHAPAMQMDDNVIGFAPREPRARMHPGRREQTEGNEPRATLTPELAMEWARSLRSYDGSTGPKWSKEQLKPYMQQAGYQGDDMTFYAVANALYSDYAKVLKKYGLDRPEVYADLARAWIEDKDAVPDKAGAYYRYIVAKR